MDNTKTSAKSPSIEAMNGLARAGKALVLAQFMAWMDVLSSAAVAGTLTSDQIRVMARDVEANFHVLMLGGSIKIGNEEFSLTSPGFLGDALYKSIRQVQDAAIRMQNGSQTRQ